MATGTRSSLLPQCRSCARRITEIGLNGRQPLLQQQSRTVSDFRRLRQDDPTPVPARLLINVKGYGRRGSVVPVARGKMEFEFFPERKAKYLTDEEIKRREERGERLERNEKYGLSNKELEEIRQRELEKANAEKDAKAKLEEQAKQAAEEAEQAKKAKKVDLLSPKRSMELLDIFVPATFVDYRDPIESGKEDALASNRRSRRPVDPYSAAALLAAAAASAAAHVPTRTYGRLTTRDFASFITKELSRNEEASRVVVTEKDVKFVDVGEAGDETGVDLLGEYTVEIKVKGAEESITRKARLASTAELKV